MPKVLGRNLRVALFIYLAIFGITVVGLVPAVAAEDTVKASIDKPLPAECALLDDPEKRALMDGLLFKLLVLCDRTDELELLRCPY